MLSKIKEEHPTWLLISISGWIPDGILENVDTQDKSLAPSKDIYTEYDENPDWELYTKRFLAERLPKVDFLKKLENWEEIANNNNKDVENIVLFCYEKPEDFCHRHIVSEAIEKEFRTEVQEFGCDSHDRTQYRIKPKANTDFLF